MATKEKPRPKSASRVKPVTDPAEEIDPKALPLTKIAVAAARCRACPLWENATQTVFGEGPLKADIILVGEQPGDQEDTQGRPFVGPAGRILDRALADAGIDRSRVYITNMVKHFKWKPRGKRRLHAKPNASEIRACRPWLDMELAKLRPRTIVCLGSTAAKGVIRKDFRITAERGLVPDADHLAPRVVATVHPSYLLRIRDDESRRAETRKFIDDLKLAAANAK